MSGLLLIICVVAVANFETSIAHPSSGDENISLCRSRFSSVVTCTDEGVLLKYGYCATIDEESENTFVSKCPYYQLQGHNVSFELAGYIVLPYNVSELNDLMCGPMNRKGFLCRDCIDGFGPSATSLGYKCSNCTDAWYGVPLYLAVEFVPMTLFYLIILLFKIHLTSAPLTSFIMYSQMLVYVFFIGRKEPVERIMSQAENSPLFMAVLMFYGVWNLDFVRYVTPPFCVSSKFRPTHNELLDYFSNFYLLFLVFVTWCCIELHGRNFRLLVWLWKPFHKCFVRFHRRWNTRNDIVDVFASLFLLFYVKSLYLGLVLYSCFPVKYASKTIKYNSCIDFDGHFSSHTVKYFVIVMFLALNIVPLLLFVLYPFQWFRRCLSKCRMDKIVITMFVEKFQGSYRDGLQGGRDMRFFSGLNFLMLLLICQYHATPLKMKLKVSVWLYVAFICVLFALLIAFLKPYKKTYMNVLDALILIHCATVCLLLSRNYFIGDETQIFVVLLLLPMLLLISLIVLKMSTCTGLKARLIRGWEHWCKKSADQSERGGLLKERKLMYPTSTVVDIGLYGACSNNE